MKVDLSQTVGIDGMRQLDTPELGALEALGAPDGTEWIEIEPVSPLEAAARGRRKLRVLVTKPEAFAGREGYQPVFLGDWAIPLPKPKGALTNDVLKLRRGGSGFELKYEHFSAVQSKSRRMPMFVAVNIDGTHKRTITRTSIPWRFDGRLDVTDQIGDEVYQKNALDRGHMVRREDPNWGDIEIARRANVDTFHFTNACPQMAKVNQHVWLGLENYILHNTRKEDMRVSVFTGPVLTENDFPYRGAFVPKSFWKIVAVVIEDGRPSATAYEVSQEQELSELEFAFGEYKTFQCSIRSIEEKTSLSFGDLSRYDGYSVTENTTGAPVRTQLENLEMLRV